MNNEDLKPEITIYLNGSKVEVINDIKKITARYKDFFEFQFNEMNNKLKGKVGFCFTKGSTELSGTNFQKSNELLEELYELMDVYDLELEVAPEGGSHDS